MTMLTDPDERPDDDTGTPDDALDALAAFILAAEDDDLEDELDEDDEEDDDLDEDDDELGQATTEYALVLLGAALVALLLIAWATSGGGAGKVGHLLDAVLDAITSKL